MIVADALFQPASESSSAEVIWPAKDFWAISHALAKKTTIAAIYYFDLVAVDRWQLQFITPTVSSRFQVDLSWPSIDLGRNVFIDKAIEGVMSTSSSVCVSVCIGVFVCVCTVATCSVCLRFETLDVYPNTSIGVVRILLSIVVNKHRATYSSCWQSSSDPGQSSAASELCRNSSPAHS